MVKGYRQLGLDERKEIQTGLDRGDPFRSIARLIGRDVSTVSREVRENRTIRAFKPRRAACRDRNWCKRVGVCADCLRPGAFCTGCDARDCRDECRAYARQDACDVLTRAPWVCNGCRRNRYGCSRPNRFVYDAAVAHKASAARRSDSRSGIDMPQEKAELALAHVRDGVSRGLSPYEISVLYEDVVGVDRSTIYRWVEAGYGGLTALELERKVGFKPRARTKARKTTSHSSERSHDAFELLPEDAKAARTEMDSVLGRNVDRQAVLTLYNLPCHLQLGLLYSAHDHGDVEVVLAGLRSVMPEAMYAGWMRTVLTDNGDEFSDEDGVGDVLGERDVGGERRIHLYYCDARQSQQKGGCEKNHTELRQLLEKGMFIFDELDRRDMAVAMSHVNSNPRESLGGKSPIQMLRFLYGAEDADALLDALGVHEVPRDELMLRPGILDIERAKRGLPPLTRLK